MCVATNNEDKNDQDIPGANSANSQAKVENVDLSNNKVETLTSHLGNNVYGVHIDNDISKFGMDTDASVPLASALCRPIRLSDMQGIGTGDVITWNVNTYDHFNFDPWVKWQEHPFIADKLKNFSYLKMNLVVRFVPACTNFQYGKYMINYVPYGFRNSIYQSAQGELRRGGFGANNMYLQYISTYPITGYLDAADNNVVELKLPFIWHKNYMRVAGSPENITTSSGRDSLGILSCTVQNRLRVANPDAKNTADISVYVHAEDVEVFMPTTAVPTSGKGRKKMVKRVKKVQDEVDEGASGVVSAPATALSNFSRTMENVPYIGPYARATTIAASAISNVARIFGFSNPPEIRTPEPYIYQNFDNTATVIGGNSAFPLSLDPKQEVTIDPTVIGVSAADEMSFAAIVNREQFLTRTRWAGENGPFPDVGLEKLLFISVVNPTQCNRGQGETLGIATRTVSPAGHIAQLFKYWKGSITYRFEVVASKYHSGVIQIAFEPARSNNGAPTANPTSTDPSLRHTVLLDISESHEAEITIDYVCDRPFLETRGEEEATFQPRDDNNGAYGSVFDERSDLGYVSCTIINELTAPGDTADLSATGATVDINVYFRCDPDMTFACPNETFADDVFFPTSNVYEDDMVTSANDPEPLTYFGERFTSIRPLLKRSTLAAVKDFTFGGGSDPGTEVNYTFAVPLYSYDRFLTGDLEYRTSYENYLSKMYLARRGGMRWKLFFKGRSTVPLSRCYIAAERSTAEDTLGLAGAGSTIVNSSTYPNFCNGGVVVDSDNRCSLDIQIPFQSNTRFDLACYRSFLYSPDQVRQNPTMDTILGARVDVTGRDAYNFAVVEYCSTAEDYSLMMFLAPPPRYINA